MPIITVREALRQALDQAMAANDSVIVFGEDVAEFGGAFKVTRGLWNKYGPRRVRDTPISEAAIIGLAIGAAELGMRPVAEIMFCDFLYVAMDQIVNQLAKMKYMLGGQAVLPVVVRTTYGAGVSAAAQHSQSNEALFLHTPGLKIAMPSNPLDAKGLLTTAIDDPNPVLFFEHKCLYDSKGEVPEGDVRIPFGKCSIKKTGTDVTVVATGLMVQRSMEAATKLEPEGISVEVIDPRTLAPLDMESILESVEKTGRLVVVHEAPMVGGAAAEISAQVTERGFRSLKAPVMRVCGADVPMPFAPVLEKAVVPDCAAVMAGIRAAARYSR
jgi:acetoin:2,6-dichlorophenolindophenol oxidoreductase subunit beta